MYYTNAHKKIYNKINKNKIIKNKIDKIYIYIIILKILLKTLYIKLFQKINKINIVKIDKNTYKLYYTFNNKIYIKILKEQKGPLPYFQVNSEKLEDLTELITSYYGPDKNWHNAEISPNMLNLNELNFEMKNGETKKFKKDEIINLN